MSVIYNFVQPRTKRKIGDRAFSVAGPWPWTSEQAVNRIQADDRRLFNDTNFSWYCILHMGLKTAQT